jgi:hypothetical protein
VRSRLAARGTFANTGTPRCPVPRRVHGVPPRRGRRSVVSRSRTGGWSSRGSESLYEPDAEPAAEGTAILQSLMSVGTSPGVARVPRLNATALRLATPSPTPARLAGPTTDLVRRVRAAWGIQAHPRSGGRVAWSRRGARRRRPGGGVSGVSLINIVDASPSGRTSCESSTTAVA